MMTVKTKVKRKKGLKFTDADLKLNREGLISTNQRWQVLRHIFNLLLLAGSMSYIPLIGLIVFYLISQNISLLFIAVPFLFMTILITLFLWIAGFGKTLSDYYCLPVEVAIGFPKKKSDGVAYFGEQRIEFMHGEDDFLDKDTRYQVYFLMKSQLCLSFEAIGSRKEFYDS